MKFPVSWLLAWCLATVCLPAPSVRAGDTADNKAVATAPPAAETATVERRPFQFPSSEFDYEESYVGSAPVRRSGQDDSVDEHYTLLHAVFTPRTPIGFLRLGAEWERFSFGLGDNSPVPNTLQAIKLVLGLDTKIGDSILLRIEAQPGFYGSHFTSVRARDLNVPFLAGGTYIYSPNFQFVLGFSVDLNRKFPVLPAAGFRWQVLPSLILDAVLPEPRLEYEVDRATTVFVGANLQGGTFRVGRHYGDKHRDEDPSLNGAVVTFSEIRIGAGATRKLTDSLSFSAEVGCQVYREFDFYRADARYHGNGPAAYGALSLHAAF